MAYPANLTTLTATHRVVSASGQPLKGYVTATPADRVWAEDGSIVAYDAKVQIADDGSYQIELPHVDQAAIRNKGVPWRIQESVPGRPRSFWVAPMVAMGTGTVDVATMLTTAPASKQTVIQAGPVTDAAAAGLLNIPGGQFAASLSTTIGTELDAQVPSAVAGVIADDPTVVEEAATRAVSVAADPAVAALVVPTSATGRALGSTFEQVIALAGRGVSHTATATYNTETIRAAIIEAEQTGATVVFPPTPAGQRIILNDSLPINTGGIRIRGAGKYQTQIQQAGWIKPIFDVTAPNVVIEDMWLDQGPYGTNDATLFRGEPRTSYNSGVWAGADNVEVRNVHVSRLVAGVHFAAWDATTDTQRAPLRGCSAHNISSDRTVFGLLPVGVAGFQCSNITGTYSLNGTSTPPHLVYFSEGLGMNYDVAGHTFHAWDSPAAQYAYQFKGIIGGRFTDLTARDCKGYLHVMESSDIKIVGGHSIGDTASGAGGGASVSVEATNTRVAIEDITVEMASDATAVVFHNDVTDSTLKNARIISNHTTNGASDSADVLLRGTRNTAEDVEVRNTGTAQWQASISAWAGDGHRIIRPVTAGNRMGVQVRGNAHDIEVTDYDLTRIGGTLKSLDVSTASTGITVRPITPVTGQVGNDRVIAVERGDFPDGTWWGLGLAGTGQRWTHLAGTWLNENGRVHLQASVVNGVAFLDLATPDVEIEAGAVYANREALVVRVIDRNNLIGVRLNHTTNTFELYKADTAVSTVLASVPFTPAVGVRYGLRVAITGASLTAVLNGGVAGLSYTLTADEQAKYTSTKHGILATAVAGVFDNIVFRTP